LYFCTTRPTTSVHSVMAPSPAKSKSITCLRLTRRGATRRAALTDIAARERLSDRPVHLVAKFFSDYLELLGRQWVRVHVRVHGREEVDGDETRSRAQERGLHGSGGAVSYICPSVVPLEGFGGTHDNVVADPCGDFGERVGRARRHENNVCPPTELCKCKLASQDRAAPGVLPAQRTYLDVQNRVTDLLPRLQSRVEQGSARLLLHASTTRELTAHSSASVQTRTRPVDSRSICSAEKKCVDDFEATTWTSTLAYCSHRGSGEGEHDFGAKQRGKASANKEKDEQQH
jgi:hypothetical protein